MSTPAAFVALLLTLPLLTQSAPDEKELREAFKQAMHSKDASERVAAVAEYGNATRELEDGGASKLVAKTLAAALVDEDMAVAGAAVSALAWGRHVDTVITSMDKGLEEWRGLLEKTSTRPDEESRDLFRGALATYRAGCTSLARYADDRTVDLLEGELKALRTGGPVEDIGLNLVPTLARSLLELGSRDAVEMVVDQTGVFIASTFKGTSAMQKRDLAIAEALHEALSEFARRVERAPPAFSQSYHQDWHDWFEENKGLFKKKLGKLSEPLTAPDYVPPGERDSKGPTGEKERP